MTNSLIAIRKFLTGEDDSTIKEIYQIAMINQAQILAESTSPLPFSITPQELQVFMIKALLSDALRFDAMAKIKLTELAMNEAVIGNNPRIDLVLEPNPSNPNSLRLKSPTEAEIIQSVQSQFADDALTLELLSKGLIQLLLTFK